MTFRQAKTVIDAIAYARKRLNTTSTAIVRGGKFSAPVTESDRNRVARALDTAFLGGLKRPLVAFTDPDNDLDEPRGNDLDLG